MKYLRFVNHDDVTCCGIVNPDGSIDLLKGEILGRHQRTGQTCSFDDIKQYLIPIDVPNVVALGLNYRAHVAESTWQEPTAPLIFLKATTSLTANQCDIILPRSAPDEVDYEAELVVVIGKQAKNISPDQVNDYIFGYTCGNDVTARDCQFRHDKQWARAKSFDTFAPIGPVIETELDPANVRVRSILNDDCMQDSSSADMIFPVAEVVSYLSQNMTLLAGTLIMTGTPPGVGFARKPPVFLKGGDKIVVEIEGIGSLENHVIAE